MSEQLSSAIKRSVSTRAKNYCEYCRIPGQFVPESLTVDHIIPRQLGGETRLDNLAWSCNGYNSHKSTKIDEADPETGEKAALFNPRKQVWLEHFSWSEDFTEAIGKTSCGRATIKALRLNRTGVVNLRRLLVMAALYPPAET